jgi:hypothetical protein
MSAFAEPRHFQLNRDTLFLGGCKVKNSFTIKANGNLMENVT